MKSPRNAMLVLSAVSMVLAIGCVVLIGASHGLVMMVVEDMIVPLRQDGTLSQAQVDRVVSDVRQYTRPARAVQQFVPAGALLLFGLVQLAVGLSISRSVVDARSDP
ncbi:MAG: hypothetical protein IT438_06300 [Phycisphaerales bacterium]|nr:hypothetical protein [Phycisphaerales bacterium]